MDISTLPVGAKFTYKVGRVTEKDIYNGKTTNPLRVQELLRILNDSSVIAAEVTRQFPNDEPHRIGLGLENYYNDKRTYIKVLTSNGEINEVVYGNPRMSPEWRSRNQKIEVLSLPLIQVISSNLGNTQYNKLRTQATRDGLEYATGTDMSPDTGPLKSILNFIGIPLGKNTTIGRARKHKKRKTRRRSNRYRSALKA